MDNLNANSRYTFAPYIYGAAFNNSIIILDARSNKYFSLIDDAAKYLHMILKSTTINRVDLDELYWINYFIENGIVVMSDKTTTLRSPLKSGGLKEYKWDSKHASWKPFSQTSYLNIFRALRELRRVHRMLKRDDMVGIIKSVEDASKCVKGDLLPSDAELKELSAAVDAASLLYPKKTYCLVWATTFVLLALKRGFKMNLVFGVETEPFYAHAWAETMSGAVVNDDPSVAQVLSVILKAPYSSEI